MEKEIQEIRSSFSEALSQANDLVALENVRVGFLGRKSPLNLILKGMKDLAEGEKKIVGPLANEARGAMVAALGSKEKELRQKEDAQKDWIDVTAPGRGDRLGRPHVISQVQREIEEIFTSLGFEIADGPEVEDEWHNFTALNMPADHPARDMQDTFWIEGEDKEEKKHFLPRTQTSNVQIRYMKKNDPPIRIIVPGRVFRNEATDPTHEHTFHQFEALVVGKDISIANFKDIAQKFFSAFFGREIKVRLRPSYFPFTEPSFEFDISCTVCGGSGCKSCKGGGFLEVGGCGMVNQRVFEAVGYKRDAWQGFAWGFGLERLAMMKYKIDDIRLFESGDLRFLRQF